MAKYAHTFDGKIIAVKSTTRENQPIRSKNGKLMKFLTVRIETNKGPQVVRASVAEGYSTYSDIQVGDRYKLGVTAKDIELYNERKSAYNPETDKYKPELLFSLAGMINSDVEDFLDF